MGVPDVFLDTMETIPDLLDAIFAVMAIAVG